MAANVTTNAFWTSFHKTEPMKKFIYTILTLLIALGSSAQAANLFANNFINGLTLEGGTNALSSGTIKFGFFPSDFDIKANITSFVAMDTAFVEVASYSGDISAFDTNGFFDLSLPYSTTVSFEGRPYDSTAASTDDTSTTDLVGEKIYIWVFNDLNPANATQQAIFSSDAKWVDADTFVPDSFVTPDSTAPGLVAHFGTLSTGVNIGGEANSHSLLGINTVTVSDVVASRNPSGADVVVGTPVTFSYTALGTQPFTQEWYKEGSSDVLGTEPTLVLTNAQIAESGEYFVKVSNAGGDSTSSKVILNVVTPIPSFSDHPDMAAVTVGANVTFTATAIGQGPLSYRWLKGTVAVPGAITDSLTLYGVGLADSALYRCEVSNVVAGKPNKILSNQALLTVVQDNTPVSRVVVRPTATGSTTLTLSYAETGVATSNKARLQWKKDGAIIPGQITKTLKITPLQVSANPVLYTCEVQATGVASPTVGASTEVIVVNEAPLIINALTLNMPDGKVGEPYSYQVPVDAALAKTPAMFSAVLPKGLMINRFTGEITGRPQAITLSGKPFKVTVTVSNGVLPNAVASDTIEIAPLAPNLSGKWVGPIERAPLSQDLGGRFELDLQPTGAASGTITLGAVVHRFAGGLVPDPVNNKHTVTMIVKRLINQPPLTVSFSLSQNLLTDGAITDGTEIVTFEGWRNRWLATPAAATAADYLANYRLRLQNDDQIVVGNLDYPQGISFASFSVAKDGKLTFMGKLADGELITGSTFVGPTGQAFMYQPLYKTVLKGSLLGKFEIDTKANADVKDNTLSGAANWSRPANLVKNTLYAEGFPAVSLDIKGGAYTAPLTPLQVLNIASGTNNAEVKLNGAALNVNGSDVTETASITTGSKITVGNVGLLNIKLTAVPTTGAFGGTLVSRTRTEKLEGMIVPIEGVLTGVGFFLVNDSNPITAQTKRLSGGVTIKAVP